MKKIVFFEFMQILFQKMSTGITAFTILFLINTQFSFAQQWSVIGSEAQISATAATYTSITMVEDVPYVVYVEGSSSGIGKVKKFNSSGVWEQVGGNLSANAISFTRIFSDKTGKLYVSYIDNTTSSKLAVATFNGLVWETVGGAGVYVSDGNATHSGTQTTIRSDIAFDSNNVPYITYAERTTTGTTVQGAYVKRFNGTAWEAVGSATGLLSSDTYTIGNAITLDSSNIPFVVYIKQAPTNAESSGQLVVYRLNASNKWENIALPAPVLPGSVTTGATSSIRHSTIALDSDNNPVVCYFNTSSSNKSSQIRFTKSTNTWDYLGTAGTRDANRTTLINDNDGNLYNIFLDALVNGGTSSTLRVYKRNAGATSTFAELVNTPITSSSGVGIDAAASNIAIAVGNDTSKPYIVYTKLNSNGIITPIVRFFDRLVVTKPITNITTSSASSGGDIASDGVTTITERGIVYSTSANPTVADTKITDSSAGTGSYISNITGLLPGTGYNVRAYSINSASEITYGANITFSTLAPTTDSVTIIDNGTTVVLNNGIVKATINKSNASVSSLIYNGIEMIKGGYNGGSVYWSWNMPNYQNPTGCTYSLVTNPNTNNFESVEIKLNMNWSGSTSTAAMDVAVYYSLQKNVSGLYASATLSHPTSYPANPGGEWRMASYPNPRFNWLSVDSLRNLIIPSGADATAAVAGAPPENYLITSGPFTNKYECKYDYSADFGAIDTWGWSSTADNVGLWVTAPSKEYYPGGPMKRELMCHSAPVLLNMLGGTHYGQGTETAVAAGEDWQKTFGPFLIYCNNVPNGTANAPIALWEDAKAKAKIEQAAWPYNWHNDPAYIKESGRGTVTGKLVIDDATNPSASAADTWVGLAIPPTGSGNATNFQAWSKNYQFWVKTDANGNFSIPHVLPGTYSLFAFGPGANGQLSLSNYATVTAANTTSLGTVNWTPTRIAPTVWEIGTPDRTASEFKHGTDWWTSNTYPNPNWAKFMDYNSEFPNDIDFTIGQSNIATDWNYVQPSSTNVPVSNPTWNVNFNLANAPASGSTASVYVALATNNSAALILSVNGVNVTSPSTGMIPGNDTNAMIRKGIHGAFAEVRFNFPSSYLKTGANKISFSIRKTGGSSSGEVMYDYLRLEASGTTLSTKSFVQEDLVKAFPNPTKDIVNVSIPENSILEKIAVYNSLGQIVATHFKNSISLEKLDSGTYYLLINTSTGKYVKKIIKL